MVTNSSTVTLDYHTDSDGGSRGWSLDYRTHRETLEVDFEEDYYRKIILKITQSVVFSSD